MKNKIIVGIMTVMLFVSISVPYLYSSNNAFASNPESTGLIVSAELLYLRDGPGLSYPILTTLGKGQELTFIEKQDDWYHVSIDGQEGWVASWLTSKQQDQTGEVPYASTGISQVDHLNIRSEPSLSGPVLGQLSSGDEVNVIQVQNDWTEINYNGMNGWVSSNYISIIADEQKSEQSPSSSEETEDEQTNDSTLVETDPNTFTVIVDAVNVRKSSNLSSKKLGVIYKGEQYEVLDRENNWVQIKSKDGTLGWIYSFYGSFSTQVKPANESTKDETSSSSSSENETVTIIYNGTNLRSEASTSSNIVAHVNAGETFPIISMEGDWYKVKVNNEPAYVASWVVSTDANTSTQQETQEERKKGTLKGVSIVIDPGHGGNDHGTTGIRGTKEKDINLKTVEFLKAKLRAAGATVYLTRESDVYVDLRKRVSISHQYNADAFISIHYDATDDSSVSGFTTYYTNGYQQELAEYVHNGLAKKVDIRDRGVQPGNYLVTRENRQNAILIELGYLSNPSEERTVTTDYYREQASLGIYQGILDYFDAQLEE